MTTAEGANTQTAIAPTSIIPLTLKCAWCLKDAGIPPRPGDSHGICVPHALKEWQKLQAIRRLRRAQQAEQNAEEGATHDLRS